MFAKAVSKKIIVSIVVPVLNEVGAVGFLFEKIRKVCDAAGIISEIIFVDDGSWDNTVDILMKLAEVKVIRLQKNFGQTAALDAGIKAAKGKYIVTMDGDGQNDPADIPKLLKTLEEGNYDCVCGWRKYRKDPFVKRFISSGALFLRNRFIHDGVHDSGCTLKIFRRECFQNIDLYGEMHRFIPALLKIRGYKIGEVVVRHHPRKYGKTKYNWKRTIKGGLDILSLWFWGKYSNRPLHLFGTLGLLTLAISVASGIYAIYMKIFHGADLSSSTFTFIALSGTFSAIQFLVFGIMLDLLVKNYYASKKVMNYEIAEIIETMSISGRKGVRSKVYKGEAGKH